MRVQRVIEVVNVSNRRNAGEERRHDETYEEEEPQDTDQRFAVRTKLKFSSNEVILHKKKPS